MNQKKISNYEIIIVDDASTDNGINLIKKYKFNNLKILSQKKIVAPQQPEILDLRMQEGNMFISLMEMI